MIAYLLLSFAIGFIVAGLLIFFFTEPTHRSYGRQFSVRNPCDKDPDFSLQSSNRAANAVNSFLQFLFQELKDTGKVRRYFIRKIKIELDEITKRKVLSSIIRNIQIRDFSLGDASPEFSALSLRDCSYDSTGLLQTVQIYTHIKYSLGFSLSTVVETLLDKSAILSFKLNKFESDAYFVLCREPFTHWYLSFCRDPHIEITVSTQVGARNIPPVANLIANQLRKAILRKHTWPAYKIRFRPFFMAPPSLEVDDDHLVVRDGKPLTDILTNAKPFEIIVVEVHCLERLADSFADVLTSPNFTTRHQLVVAAMLSDISIHDELSGSKLVENLESHPFIKKIQLPKGMGDQVKLSELEVLRRPVVFVTKVNKALERLLEVGDVILQMNGHSLLSVDQFNTIYYDKLSNDNVTIVVKKIRMAQVHSQVIACGKGGTLDNGNWDVEEAVRCAMIKVNCWFSQDQLSRMKSSNPRVPGKFVNYNEAFVLRPRDCDAFCNVFLLSCREDMDQTILAYTSFTIEEIVSDCDLTLKRECQFSRSLVPTAFEPLRSLGDVCRQQGFASSLAYGHVVMGFRLMDEVDLTDLEKTVDVRDDSLVTSVKVDSYDLLDECENFTLHELHPYRLETTQYCQICNGKIWMRNALRCQQCGVLCHQKCASGCYAKSCKGIRDLSDTSLMMAKGLMAPDGQIRKRNAISTADDTFNKETFTTFGFKEARQLIEDEQLYLQTLEIGHHLYLSASSTESKAQLKSKVNELSKMITKELMQTSIHKSVSSASVNLTISSHKNEKIKSLATLYLVHLSALDELSTEGEVVSAILDEMITRIEATHTDSADQTSAKPDSSLVQFAAPGVQVGTKTKFFQNVGKFVRSHPNVVTAYSKYKDKMLSRVWPTSSAAATHQSASQQTSNGKTQLQLQQRHSYAKSTENVSNFEENT